MKGHIRAAYHKKGLSLNFLNTKIKRRQPVELQLLATPMNRKSATSKKTRMAKMAARGGYAPLCKVRYLRLISDRLALVSV